MRASAVLLAAGKGSRFGAPKQFLLVHGKPVYAYSLERFLPLVDEVILVIPQGYPMEKIPHLGRYMDRVKVVEGGEERFHSSFNGIRHATGDVVLIHDTARALVSGELIRRVLDALRVHRAVVPVVRVRDTLRREDGEEVDRSGLFAVQTPQGFFREDMLLAYERAIGDGAFGTDDAYFYRRYVSRNLHFVEGDGRNFKITYPEDMEMFSRMALVDVRVGYGWDVHPVVEGRDFYIAGLKVAEGYGPEGHSDGDSLSHALIDAMLGATGMGNIGQMFPDTSSRWEGASSLDMLRDTARVLRDSGWVVLNVDGVMILERPRLGDFLPEIVGRIAKAIGVDTERVSIKPKSGNRVRRGIFEAQVVVRMGREG